jgi:Spore coat polysaccharide biosynthesis protein, predicted glycosyltransferase
MNALFITHAGERIGGGHLARCFALSQALEEHSITSSWLANPACKQWIGNFGIRNVTFLENLFDAKALKKIDIPELVVLDSYEADEPLYSILAARSHLVAIEDFPRANADKYASCLVNYSFFAAHAYGCRHASCRYLLGPRYALLRKDYWDLPTATGDYILFIAGASDVLNASGDIASLWREEWPPLCIVQGGFVPPAFRETVKGIVRRRKNITLLVAPDNFANLVAGAGTVFCTASVTAYEALSLKKNVVLFDVVENQKGMGELLADIKAAYYLGHWSNVDRMKIQTALDFQADSSTLDGLVAPSGARNCAAGVIEWVMGYD